MQSSDSSSTLLLGVDGGGTKTSAWLATADSNGELVVLGRGLAGPGNPGAMGFPAALRNIELAIASAFEQTQLPQQTIDSACLCIAGAGRESEQAQIIHWAKSNALSRTLHVVGDAEVVLAAAGSSVGTETNAPSKLLPRSSSAVALVAGTGSIAWGKSSEGRSLRSGGWGYLLGDEGSGYALGRGLLQLACQTADGRLNEPAVLNAVLERTECNQPSDLIPWTYNAPHATPGQSLSPSPKERIAELSVLCFELALTQQCVHDLVTEGATHLANMVHSVVQQLDSTRYSLALTGSLLCKQPSYCELVQNQLRLLNIAPTQSKLVEEPVQGAVQLAWDYWSQSP
ncbi:N-acetylglucosamine kinase [Aureliella helgolandensis]|uniref:BadF/BadG/BcrA/BcrD ATPase family protein n=1 Tax=Aureliella helgolandensis TaxID=2527968 RepID=A0A518G7M0_9BACT|nr:BadF/BadG/BcrA/BcrD ATPase family protein [Aureliella helgolandensis]QDV24572.1 BadF/BadG/BcrA/BcrD ATPase family protein [Aureliella helgolandensis]